jgi:hypothetical protein
MLVAIKRWKEISYLFNQNEKNQLNKAITGETICPPGLAIDESKLDKQLLRKLKSVYDCN